MLNFNHLLSIIIWLPIVIGLSCIIITSKILNKLVEITSLCSVFATCIIFKFFVSHGIGLNFTEFYPLLPDFGINYFLGVNELGAILLGLSSFINFLLLCNISTEKDRTLKSKASLLILHGLSNGVISSVNAGMFYIFAEMIILALFFIIIANQKLNKINFSLKILCLYSLSSLLLLITLIYLREFALKSGIEPNIALDFNNLYKLNLTFSQQTYIMLALLFGIIIKAPLVPLHSWFGQTKPELSVENNIYLNIVFANLGILTLFKFLLPIAPQSCIYFNKFIVGIIVLWMGAIGLITLSETNYKKIIINTAIIEMNLIIIGLFSGFDLIATDFDLAASSLAGAVMQIIHLELIFAGLLLFYSRFTESFKNDFTLNLFQQAQALNAKSICSKILFFLSLGHICFPGTPGFLAKFLIVTSSYNSNILLGSLIGIIIAFNLSYILNYYKKIFYNINLGCAPELKQNLPLKQLKQLGPILASGGLIITIGCYPSPWFKLINNFVNDFILTLGK